jgi:hypothetical protein
VKSLSERELDLTVDYSYGSSHGNDAFLAAAVLQGGRPRSWFGHRPAHVTPGKGRATIRLTFGFNDPPKCVATDQVEVYFRAPGAPSFHSRTFDLVKTWCREGTDSASSDPAR